MEEVLTSIVIMSQNGERYNSKVTEAPKLVILHFTKAMLAITLFGSILDPLRAWKVASNQKNSS